VGELRALTLCLILAGCASPTTPEPASPWAGDWSGVLGGFYTAAPYPEQPDNWHMTISYDGTGHATFGKRTWDVIAGDQVIATSGNRTMTITGTLEGDSLTGHATEAIEGVAVMIGYSVQLTRQRVGA
jgi:hypothetical protein